MLERMGLEDVSGFGYNMHYGFKNSKNPRQTNDSSNMARIQAGDGVDFLLR